MKRRFVLLKETPEFKVGAIFQQRVDAEIADFTCINYAEFSNSPERFHGSFTYFFSDVVNRPEWFEEVKNFDKDFAVHLDMVVTAKNLKEAIAKIKSSITSVNVREA